MKRKNIILIVIVLISLAELILLKPIIPSYFIMNFWGKLLYILGMYFYPIYIIVLVAILIFLLLLPKVKKEGYRSRLFKNIRNIYLIASIIILLFNSSILISKYALNDPFPLVEYSSIEGASSDISDIKVGTFTCEGCVIVRNSNTEIFISDANDTIIYDLIWISENEYEVTARVDNSWSKDKSTRILITNNMPDYYECFAKYGKYADYNKIYK